MLALAAVSYLPLLLTHIGKVGADTKQYLYLDPGRLLGRATSLWDPSVGLGTVTHQTIGYLFPMGPYYAAMDAIGVPDWIAQRLWMGTIIFAAGMGVRALLGTLSWKGNGRTVAMFAYALSPYLLHYIYKHSVILMPFSALPWLLHFTIRSFRNQNWRDPAAFALVTLTVGGINATSLLLVLVAPALWIVHAVVVERDLTARQVVAPALRIGVLTVATSIWWMAGLLLQGRYGIDILRYTETYRTVSNASSSPEVIRGLGYWFFYGTDTLGPWFTSAVTMTESVPAIALSFAIPIAAVTAALWTRWRYRVFFVATALAGLILSVGAFPFDRPSPFGSIFASWTTTSSGLAFRSTPRALPMLALASALFLGAGVAALSAHAPKRRLVFAGVAIVAIMANMSPMFTGDLLDSFLERGSDIPDYWKQVGHELDRGDPQTRALEVPGIDFAAYRWGSTVDPVTPGLTDRDFAARELVPWGSPASADLTNAIDLPFQDATFDDRGYATLMQFLGVGDVITRNDLQYERYRSPRPTQMTAWLDSASGLGAPRGFGSTEPNRAAPSNPLIDDVELGLPADQRRPSSVEVRAVDDPRQLVRAVSSHRPTIVAGSGAGFVSAANAGLTDADRLAVYSGSVSNDPDRLGRLLADDAALVVTDTNRRSALRWGSARQIDGYTEMAAETPARPDPTDNRLPLFSDRSDDTALQTVVEQRGTLRVTASGYGNELTYTPGDRAAGAVDDDPTTAWKVAAFADPTDEWIEVRSTNGPITTDQVRLLQAQRYVNRHITAAMLTFDGNDPTPITLDASSRTGEGQTVSFGKRTFTTLRITIKDTDLGRRDRYQGISGVGFSTIDLDGRTVNEVVRPPTDLLDAVGARSADHQLAYVFTRRRSNPAEPVVRDDEVVLRRVIAPPTRRSFVVSGTATVSSLRSDADIDELLGVPTNGIRFDSSSRTNGDIAHTASQAFDSSTTTYWQSALNPVQRTLLGFRSPTPVDSLLSGFVVLDDANHSVPETVHVEIDGERSATFILDRTSLGNGLAQLSFRGGPLPVRGTSLDIVVDSFEARTNPDWLSKKPVVMPVAIANVELSAPLAGETPATFDTGCRTDLLTVGDTPISLQLTGVTSDARSNRPLAFTSCDTSIDVSNTDTLVTSTPGAATGIDLATLEMIADAPSSPESLDSLTELTVSPTSRSSYDIRVGAAVGSDWLVLGQSFNAGWELTVGDTDLGPPVLVNGYANGWRIDPSVVSPGSTLHLRWAPQSTIWIGLLISALGVLVCLVLLVWPRRRAGMAAPKRTLEPVGIGRFDDFGAVLGFRTSLVVAFTAGASTALLVRGWWWTPIIAALTFGACRFRRCWPILRLVAIGTLGTMAAYVVLRQWRGGYRDDFDWPQHFETVHALGIIGFVLLGVDMVIEVLRAGWRRETGLDET